MKSLIQALIVGTALAVPVMGGALTWKYKDSPARFRFVMSDSEGVDWTGGSGHTEGSNWLATIFPAERDEHNDKLVTEFTGYHSTAPHNEPPSGDYRDAITVDADNYEDGVFGVNGGGFLNHVSHFDRYFERVGFRVESTASSDQITSYDIVFVGVHSPSLSDLIDTYAPVTSLHVVPPNPSKAHGSALVQYDRATGQLSVTMVATGVVQPLILGARLYVGLPGQNGQPIVDLGSGSQWEALGNDGSALMLDNVAFPQQYLPMLLSGKVYVSVHTMSYPQGEVRGQLRVAKLPRRTD